MKAYYDNSSGRTLFLLSTGGEVAVHWIDKKGRLREMTVLSRHPTVELAETVLWAWAIGRNAAETEISDEIVRAFHGSVQR